MNGFFRIGVATPRLHLGNPEANLDEHVRLAQEASGKGVSVLAFPELSITGYTCGDLFFRTDLIDAANAALSSYARKTMRLPLVSIVGFPERKDGNFYNAAAVVAGGEVVGIVRKRTLANYAEYYEKRQFDPAPVEEAMDDNARLRSGAVAAGVPLTTTLDGFRAAVRGLAEEGSFGGTGVRTLQEYHALR